MKSDKDFFKRARWICKQLDWMSDKGYQDHPITGNEPTYEDRMMNKPVAWAYIKDGEFFDAIHPDEHDKHEGMYNIPLYTYERPHNTVLVPCDKLAEMQAELKILTQENHDLWEQLHDK